MFNPGGVDVTSDNVAGSVHAKGQRLSGAGIINRGHAAHNRRVNRQTPEYPSSQQPHAERAKPLHTSSLGSRNRPIEFCSLSLSVQFSGEVAHVEETKFTNRGAGCGKRTGSAQKYLSFQGLDLSGQYRI